MSVPENGLYNVWGGNPRGRARIERLCWEEVWPEGRGSMHHQCDRAWKIERDGKRYCKQHDPAAVCARRAAQEAKWRAESKAREAKFVREQRADEAFVLLREAYDTYESRGVIPHKWAARTKKLLARLA